VFVSQPSGFKNPKYPNRVYKFSKALYGLKQASRAWYARLKIFVIERRYVMGSVDMTLFTLNHGIAFLLHIYVDDIIFGVFSHIFVSGFEEMMEKEFQMSMMGELTFFIRYLSEANEARYLPTSSKVHEGHDEEVHHG
jgi:hypothetical protein